MIKKRNNMKKTVIIVGVVLLVALGYYGYGLKKSSDVSAKGSASVVAEMMVEEKEKSVDSDVVTEKVMVAEGFADESLEDDSKIEEDIAVKGSLVEEIPSEEMEYSMEEQGALMNEELKEQDIAVEEDLNKEASSENIEKIIEEQEALIHAGMEENLIVEEGENVIKEQPPKQDIPLLKKTKIEMLPQTEEERIIEEEEALIKSAIEAN